MKRYVIEMANDIEKKLLSIGNEKAAYGILNIRNGYISGLCTELDAIRAMVDISINAEIK